MVIMPYRMISQYQRRRDEKPSLFSFLNNCYNLAMQQEDKVLLAVNGTLMRGLELENNLKEVGAVFIKKSKTEKAYRLYSIDDKYPAMVKGKRGKSIEVEVYELTKEAMEQVLAKEPEGLTIDKIKLKNKEEVYGVIGTPEIIEGKKDITYARGWRNYIETKKGFKKWIPLIIKGSVLLTLIILFVVLLILKSNPDIAEGFSRTVARWYGAAASFISGIFPFISLTELLFVALATLIIIFLVFFVKHMLRHNFVKAGSRMLNIAIIFAAVVTTYQFSCEAAYNRKPIPLPYYTQEIDGDEYVDIYNYFVEDVNYCVSQLEFKDSGEVKKPMSLQKTTSEVKKAYSIIKGNSYYNSHFGSVKPMMSSFLYREFQITGVTFAPLGEANIDVLIPNGDLPFTIAHELAHTKGVMREDEANQLAFYVCLNSDNPYLRFSAYNRYFFLLRSLTSKTYLSDENRNQLTAIQPQLSLYDSFERKFWEDHNLLAKIGDFFNNLYIKSSGVNEGTASYQGGTSQPPSQNPVKPIKPNQYQGLFFEKYYRNKSI